MGRRTDTRDRIIDAAVRILCEKGYAGCTISDIVAASPSPRGSVTFHFPGGKDEIVREAIALRESQVLAGVDAAAASAASPADFLGACIDRVGAEFTRSGFVSGCPVAPTVLERTADSADLRRASLQFFDAWQQRVAEHLVARDVDAARAAGIARTAVAAIEGALILSRLRADTDVLGDVRDQLCTLLTPG